MTRASRLAVITCRADSGTHLAELNVRLVFLTEIMDAVAIPVSLVHARGRVGRVSQCKEDQMATEETRSATDITHSALARRAYQIWVSEGKPNGRALDHWLQAEAEIAAGTASEILPKMTVPAKEHAAA